MPQWPKARYSPEVTLLLMLSLKSVPSSLSAPSLLPAVSPAAESVFLLVTTPVPVVLPVLALAPEGFPAALPAAAAGFVFLPAPAPVLAEARSLGLLIVFTSLPASVLLSELLLSPAFELPLVPATGPSPCTLLASAGWSMLLSGPLEPSLTSTSGLSGVSGSGLIRFGRAQNPFLK